MRRWSALVAGALLALAPAAASAQAGRSQTIIRSDGTRLTYHVDRPARAGRGGAMMVFQGSGCKPAAARASRDLLAPTLGRRFTYREYDAYDHFMTDAARVDHRSEMFAAGRDWLREASRR